MLFKNNLYGLCRCYFLLVFKWAAVSANTDLIELSGNAVKFTNTFKMRVEKFQVADKVLGLPGV